VCFDYRLLWISLCVEISTLAYAPKILSLPEFFKEIYESKNKTCAQYGFLAYP